MDSTGDAAGAQLQGAPSTCADVTTLKMPELRDLCRRHSIVYSGRVTKSNLFDLVCQHFGISTSGQLSGVHSHSAEKPPLPEKVADAYKRLPSFSHIPAGWSVEVLLKIPHFCLSSVTSYLVDSRDKDYDGESLRCYKQLRAYQLFDERHLHDLEANLWKDGTHFYFVRAKCLPSQDTSKSPHKCIVCIDREDGTCYGAHCRCVSGLGEACSHVAALLFALEDVCSRGFRSLQGPAVTDLICK